MAAMRWRRPGAAALAALLVACAVPRPCAAGLYGPDSPVVTLRPYQLDAVRADSSGRTWVVEAYASWCGHCQAFAPTYQMFAYNLSVWSDRVRVGGIDCAVDSDACIGLGVSAYPTLFIWSAETLSDRGGSVVHPPNANADDFDPADGIGISQDGAPMHVGGFPSADALLNFVLPHMPPLYSKVSDAKEARAFVAPGSGDGPTPVAFWPLDLGAVNPQHVAVLFSRRASLALVTHPEDKAVIEALGLPSNAAGSLEKRRHRGPSAVQTSSAQPAPVLYVIHGDATADGPSPPAPPFERYGGQFQSQAALESWLSARVRPQPNLTAASPSMSQADQGAGGETAAPWSKVSLNDIARGVEYAFSHEIPIVLGSAGPAGLPAASPTRQALLEWLRTLATYLPEAANREAVRRVHTSTVDALRGDGDSSGASGANLTLAMWRELSDSFALPVPAAASRDDDDGSGQWSQCAGSQPYLRGYPCSLWLTFHTLQMNSAEEDAARTLTAVHDYVTHFFSCLECRMNFALMAGNITDEIRDGVPHATAVLVLWGFHNAVNARLNMTGGDSNDPMHPKVQFPTKALCPRCVDLEKGVWVPEELLPFLSNYYCSASDRFECAMRYVQRSAWPEVPRIDGAADRSKMAIGVAFGVLMCLFALSPFLCKGACRRLGEKMDEAAESSKAEQEAGAAGGAGAYVGLADEGEGGGEDVHDPTGGSDAVHAPAAAPAVPASEV
mmetsp:Transcript_987/g.2661  ORF Transcript_987/g.2661 Transcript_987/m.2661 type:complete len:727 (-) Transcript_987:347-2527(-)